MQSVAQWSCAPFHPRRSERNEGVVVPFVARCGKRTKRFSMIRLNNWVRSPSCQKSLNKKKVLWKLQCAIHGSAEYIVFHTSHSDREVLKCVSVTIRVTFCSTLFSVLRCQLARFLFFGLLSLHVPCAHPVHTRQTQQEPITERTERLHTTDTHLDTTRC